MTITFRGRTVEVAIDHADHTTDIYLVPIGVPIGVAVVLLLLGWVAFRMFRNSN